MDIKIVDEKYENITYRILYSETTVNKPVIFFFHGFGGNKESSVDDNRLALAKLGYVVLIMDAFEHGERMSEEYKALSNQEKQKLIVDTEIITAHEAIELYDYLVKSNKISGDQKLGVMGVSMGGAIAFYLASIFEKVEVVVSIVGSPSFVKFYEYKQKVYKFAKDDGFKERLNKYKGLDPLINYERLKNKAIYMSVGLKDRIVPMDYAKELSLKLKTTYQEYDVEHTSTENMLNEVVKFIQNNLL